MRIAVPVVNPRRCPCSNHATLPSIWCFRRPCPATGQKNIWNLCESRAVSDAIDVLSGCKLLSGMRKWGNSVRRRFPQTDNELDYAKWWWDTPNHHEAPHRL